MTNKPNHQSKKKKTSEEKLSIEKPEKILQIQADENKKLDMNFKDQECFK